MIRSLQGQFDYLEAQRNRLIDRFTQLRPEQLAFSPGQNKWSMLQVAQHLIVVEAGTGQQASENLRAAVSDKRIPWTSHITFLFAAMTLPLPIRVSAPKQALPTRDWDFDQIVETWEQTRTEWRLLLENVPPNRLSYPAVKHPIFGWFSISQILRFHAMHFDHHLLQIGRIQRDRNYPR